MLTEAVTNASQTPDEKTSRTKRAFIPLQGGRGRLGNPVHLSCLPRHGGFPLKPTLPASPIFTPPHHDRPLQPPFQTGTKNSVPSLSPFRCKMSVWDELKLT